MHLVTALFQGARELGYVGVGIQFELGEQSLKAVAGPTLLPGHSAAELGDDLLGIGLGQVLRHGVRIVALRAGRKGGSEAPLGARKGSSIGDGWVARGVQTLTFGADCLRYLVATKSRTVVERKLRGP